MTGPDLTDARNSLGLSQKGLALALGHAGNYRVSINAYERGRRAIPGPVAMAVRCMVEHGDVK